MKLTICNDCHYIDKKTQKICVKCKSQNLDYATRVIGYLKRITSFGSGRRKEHARRIYHNMHKAKKKQTHADISVPANMAAQPKSTQARMTASAKKTKTNSEDH